MKRPQKVQLFMVASIIPSLFYIHVFVSREYKTVIKTSNTKYNAYWFKKWK